MATAKFRSLICFNSTKIIILVPILEFVSLTVYFKRFLRFITLLRLAPSAELWESKFLYWITEGRRREYFKINEKVQEYPFTSDEMIYKSMIINLMKSEAIVVQNCLVPFQNQAVKKSIKYQNESDNL